MVEKNELIFGTRAVIEAIEAGRDIDKILIKRSLQNELSRELFDALKGHLIPVQRVPIEKLNRLTTKNHQGVIAFTSAVTYQRVEDLVPILYEEGKNLERSTHYLYAASPTSGMRSSTLRTVVSA